MKTKKFFKIFANFEQDGEVSKRMEPEKTKIISATSLDEALIFLAYNYPEYYFGSNIIECAENGDSIPNGDFHCVAVYDYFASTCEGRDISPLSLAVEQMSNSVRIKSNLCNVETEYNGDTCYSFPKLEEF